MGSQEESILETVSNPHLVQEGDSGRLIALRHYAKTPLTEKFCAVVYCETRGARRFRHHCVLLLGLLPSQEDLMEAVKVFEKKKGMPLDWTYEGEADTLYISFGPPRPATGLDVGEGIIVRYDEKAREVVGSSQLALRTCSSNLRPTPMIVSASLVQSCHHASRS